MITLYDFETKLPGKALSPFGWKIRFALNIKGLQHKTHWVAFSRIAEQLQELGLPPSSIVPNNYGTYHTVPALSDTSTGAKISDSKVILKYLDETYPDTPQLYVRPPGNAEFEALMAEALALPFAMMRPIWIVTSPKIVLEGLDGADAARYRPRVEAALGTTPEEFIKDEESKERYAREAREAFGVADEWLRKAKKVYGGRWALGHEITMADIEIGSALAFTASILGEEDELWKKITREWDEGRWGEYWGQIKEYTKLGERVVSEE
ncbi:hypothetical protein D9611_010524 [Ephemerocybe angulata]|uniref:GST N-terminal domain-containing protein n=1 Tax=Ephemerocybe angulata TaxID=980116 RepID=A0A8H5FAT1_9AGAR|nr:hypothetical protein D9611_010524 [Tulosesus angulatus]